MMTDGFGKARIAILFTAAARWASGKPEDLSRDD
jgi:hypothetical protein